MSDPIHRLKLTFDPAFGSLTAELICPEAGCQPPGYCSECGREWHDADREPCDCCSPDDSTECCAKQWCDHDFSANWIDGAITVPVAITWENGDEGPTLEIVPVAEHVTEESHDARLPKHTVTLDAADLATIQTLLASDRRSLSLGDARIARAHDNLTAQVPAVTSAQVIRQVLSAEGKWSIADEAEHVTEGPPPC